MGLTLAKCPACGAELNLETDRDYFYCPHCSSKVLQQDNRIVIEHVNRTIDEAEVRKNEFEREKYFLEKKQNEENRKKKVKQSKHIMVIGLLLFIIGFTVDKLKQHSYELAGINLMLLSSLVIFVGFALFVSNAFGKDSSSKPSNEGDESQAE